GRRRCRVDVADQRHSRPLTSRWRHSRSMRRHRLDHARRRAHRPLRPRDRDRPGQGRARCTALAGGDRPNRDPGAVRRHDAIPSDSGEDVMSKDNDKNDESKKAGKKPVVTGKGPDKMGYGQQVTTKSDGAKQAGKKPTVTGKGPHKSGYGQQVMTKS